MKNLISRVRDNIADPAGPSQRYSDEQIQVVLDECRQDFRYLELRGAHTIRSTPNGLGGYTHDTVYLDFYSDWGDWEEDATLLSYDYLDITSDATPDYVTGHWQFAANHWPPVYLTGKTYDLNLASAKMLRKWAARLKLEFDVSEDQDDLKRSQKIDMVLRMADEYARAARPRIFSMERTDVNPLA